MKLRNNWLVFLLFFACQNNSIQSEGKIQNIDSQLVTKIKIKPALRSGDIVFQNSHSSQSRAIQLATHSPYTHCGILFEDKGKWLVFEAVQPVKITPFETWVQNGIQQHYVVKRLQESDKLLNDNTLEKMKQISKKYLGKNYDIYFAWSNERIYCSELVWKVYQEALGIEVGKLEKLGDFDLSHPEVKQKLQERYGNQIPENELVISPASIFDSDKLELVMKN